MLWARLIVSLMISSVVCLIMSVQRRKIRKMNHKEYAAYKKR